jgi:predicted dehydrogenase
VVANTGVGPSHYGKKFGFRHAGTDVRAAVEDPAVNTVVIATRHDSHADLVCEALAAGKHVFVEKPLALTHDQLTRVDKIYRTQTEQGNALQLMVGFNRRFAPLTKRLYELLSAIEAPKMLVITVNAGAVPSSHWTQDSNAGGGRIIGEACHFIDLLRYLVGQTITSYSYRPMGQTESGPKDTATIVLEFSDGSIGTIHYFANGHKSFPKEMVEVFSGGQVFRIQNFRALSIWGSSASFGSRTWRQDKGQRECVAEFVKSLGRGDGAPIPYPELLEVSRTTIEISNGSYNRGMSDVNGGL